jgi:hypothetical protein
MTFSPEDALFGSRQPKVTFGGKPAMLGAEVP